MVKSGRGGRYNRNRKKGASGESTSATKSKFVAPTSGHEYVYFTMGRTKDAAAFQRTVQKLEWHVSTATGWKQGSTLGKAMTDLQNPVFNPPSRPVRPYYSSGGEVTTDWATAGTKNVAVMNNLDYAIKTGEYSHKISRNETQLEVWGDKDMKGCVFVLHHCPKNYRPS